MSALQPLSGAKRTSAGGRPPAPSARRSPVADNVKTRNFLGADYLPCHVLVEFAYRSALAGFMNHPRSDNCPFYAA